MSEDNASQYSPDAPDEGGSGATLTDQVADIDGAVPDPTTPAQAAPDQVGHQTSADRPSPPPELPVDAPAGPTLTIPEPPESPDIPVPTPDGPPPDPEVPDLPQIPDGPELATMPTPGPVHPVTPMPTVTPAHPPVPMPTVTPRPAAPPAPVEPDEPEPAVDRDAVDIDAQPTGDSEPAAPAETAPSPAEPAAATTEPAVPTEPAQQNRQPSAPRPAGGRPRGGRPGGKPGSRPGVRPSPVPSAPQPAGLVEPIVESVDPHLWGRIDDEGVVYVSTAAGERAIGNWQAGDTEAGLQHFGRKFDDFSTEIALLEARLASGTGDPKATKAQAIALREQVETLAAIGDLDTAAIRLEIVIGAADAAIAGASHARTAARAAAVKAKEALCVEAEELAESTQWKSTGDRLKAIVEEWRTIRGIDRKTDDALWKRFAKARDTFTRHRGSHFAELDKQRGAAKEAKEALIAKAEALSDATDWGETAGAYRTLMEEWKAAGRAPRDVEDALWARFRAAQEKFFSRRNKTFSDRDAEFATNAAIKEKLLAEAETIDPATGLDAAKAKMRSIQERWEAAGKVPRERIREFDTRLKAVEDKLKSAEDRHWRRTDPETSARVEQFRARVDSYRAQASKARASGDERKAREAEAQAKQWEEWLKTAQGAVEG
jgi:hypothetical protein